MISLKKLSGGGGSALGLRPLGAIQTVTSYPDQADASNWLTIYNSTTFVQVHGLSIAKGAQSFPETVYMRVTNLATGDVWAVESTTSTVQAAYHTLIGHNMVHGYTYQQQGAKITPSYVFEGGLKVEIKSSHNAANKLYITGRMDYPEVAER